MSTKGRAGIIDGQIIATVTDKFGEDRKVVQRGSRIRISSNHSTPIVAMTREASVLIAERIKAARLRRGFTLEELAIRAGMTSGWPKNRMYEIESSAAPHGTRIGTLYALASALSIEVTELLPPVADVLAKAEVKKATARVVTLSSRGRVVA